MQSAVNFLLDPSVMGMPAPKLTPYLKQRLGLTDDQVKEAFKLAGAAPRPAGASGGDGGGDGDGGGGARLDEGDAGRVGRRESVGAAAAMAVGAACGPRGAACAHGCGRWPACNR